MNKKLDAEYILLYRVVTLDDDVKDMVLRMAKVIQLNLGKDYIVSLRMAMAMLDLPTE